MAGEFEVGLAVSMLTAVSEWPPEPVELAGARLPEPLVAAWGASQGPWTILDEDPPDPVIDMDFLI